MLLMLLNSATIKSNDDKTSNSSFKKLYWEWGVCEWGVCVCAVYFLSVSKLLSHDLISPN